MEYAGFASIYMWKAENLQIDKTIYIGEGKNLSCTGETEVSVVCYVHPHTGMIMVILTILMIIA